MTTFEPQTPVQLQAASARLPMFGQSDENVSAVAAGLANTDPITSRPLLASRFTFRPSSSAQPDAGLQRDAASEIGGNMPGSSRGRSPTARAESSPPYGPASAHSSAIMTPFSTYPQAASPKPPAPPQQASMPPYANPVDPFVSDRSGDALLPPALAADGHVAHHMHSAPASCSQQLLFCRAEYYRCL